MTKMFKNIAWMEQVLKKIHRVSWRNSGEYGDTENNCSTHSMGWFEKNKAVLVLCTTPLNNWTTAIVIVSYQRSLEDDRKWSSFRLLNNYRQWELVFCLWPYNKVSKYGFGWSESTTCEKSSLLKIKTMCILFFNSTSAVHNKFVAEGQMVTKEFFLENLSHLLKRIARMRPEMWKNPVSIYSTTICQDTSQQLWQQFLAENYLLKSLRIKFFQKDIGKTVDKLSVKSQRNTVRAI